MSRHQAVLFPQGVKMAKQTVTTLVDDIDGSEATETVTFGLDGATYEIDVNEAHAADLREVLAPFLSVARRTSGSSGRARQAPSAPRQRSGSDIDPKAVRAWAEEHGVAVSPRGRIKSDVLEQYRAANG
jgi:hypothetical protein